jgi:hypothetical protein
VALAVTIFGTDRVANLQWGTLKITATNGARAGRCDFVLVNFRPEILDTLVIADGATTFFDGEVRSIKVKELGSGKFWTTVTGVDAAPAGSNGDHAAFSLSDRSASETYEDMVNDAGLPVPYAWWRLGEASGTNAVDEMGIQDGTYVNAPTLGVTGPLANVADTAVTFNGTDEEVTLGSATLLAGQTDFSVAVWAKSSSGNTTQTMYCERHATTGNAIIRLVLNNLGRPVFVYKDNAGTQDTVTPASGDWTDDAWHHFVVTKDGTACVMYVDGVSVKTATLTANNTLTSAPGRIANDPRAGSQFFPGSLDEVMIWRTWISQAQVDGLWQARDIRRYFALDYGAVSDGTTTTLSGTVSTYESGLLTGDLFGLTSLNNGLLIGGGGPSYYVQEIAYTWQNATTLLYTVSFGLTPGGAPPRLAAAFP